MIDKLRFSAPEVRNEFCLTANELAYAMNCVARIKNKAKFNSCHAVTIHDACINSCFACETIHFYLTDKSKFEILQFVLKEKQL